MSEAVSPGRSPASSAGDVVIETRNLSKTYRDFWGRSKKAALKSLDLEVRRGEIFGLLGPNGSGKTTTLKLLLGLIFPTTGQALMFGRDATDRSQIRDRVTASRTPGSTPSTSTPSVVLADIRNSR